MENKNKEKKLLIIDSNSVIHRAFHALPFLMTKKGEKTNAVYGFLLVFFKAIKDFQPDYIAAAFDLPDLTFRHKKFKEYKAKRPPTPKDLLEQIPKIKEILKTFNVPVFEKKGFEADDIIATIAFSSFVETIIVTGDMDIFQIINDNTKVYFLRKGVKDIVLYDENLVKEKFQGLIPKQILDFKALKGDASDNIPGVTGIGEKTAIKLIKEFKTLENLYQNLEKIKPRIGILLNQQKDQAFLSKDLAQMKKDVPLEFKLEKCFWKEYDKEKAIQDLKELEFHSLIHRLPLEEEKKLTLW